MTKKQGWIIYGLGFVITFSIDLFLFSGLIFPIDFRISVALAGVLEIMWGIGWLFYMLYRFYGE